MRLLSRALGRVAATTVATAALVGTGAAAAFADPGHGGPTTPTGPAPSESWEASPQQTYSWGWDGSYHWWSYGTPAWQAPATTSWQWRDDAAQPWTPQDGTVTGSSVSTMSASGGNTYAWGNCTWYAYERRLQLGLPVGSGWGNANNWARSAAAAGWTVSNTPTVGAIMVSTAGWLGHVAIVESVHDDGSFTVSEMNWVGLDVVSNRTIPSTAGLSFIA